MNPLALNLPMAARLVKPVAAFSEKPSTAFIFAWLGVASNVAVNGAVCSGSGVFVRRDGQDRRCHEGPAAPRDQAAGGDRDAVVTHSAHGTPDFEAMLVCRCDDDAIVVSATSGVQRPIAGGSR